MANEDATWNKYRKNGPNQINHDMMGPGVLGFKLLYWDRLFILMAFVRVKQIFSCLCLKQAAIAPQLPIILTVETAGPVKILLVSGVSPDCKKFWSTKWQFSVIYHHSSMSIVVCVSAMNKLGLLIYRKMTRWRGVYLGNCVLNEGMEMG